MTSIDYVPENDSLKVFVKMYFDDFLSDLVISGENRTADFFTASGTEAIDVMEQYINRKLIIKVNKKLLAAKLNDLEIVDNEVRLKIEYKTTKRPDVILVNNMIMTELYKDQSNLMIVKVDKYEEGVKLTSEITEKSFKIKQ
ncbi:MAG: hypothetical protein IPN68_02405 [Bacteroidetes bacterium]|nr:hypothetical protein [Bacteroidota bacterium]